VLITALVEGMTFDLKNVRVVICPPFTSLSLASTLIEGSPIELGAQNMYSEDEGAYTGEISPGMLTSSGCSHVIIGHSERRKIFGETDAGVNTKLKKALARQLLPIMCVGESLEERESGVTNTIVSDQVRAGLEGVTAAEMERVIIAYERYGLSGQARQPRPIRHRKCTPGSARSLARCIPMRPRRRS